MPFQMMHPRVTAEYYNTNVTPDSFVPINRNFSRCQSNVPFAPMPPADLNHMNHLHSVSANLQNSFAGHPVVRYQLPLAIQAELMNRDMQARQQFYQQQYLLQMAAAAGNNVLHPFAIAPAAMPLLAPGCIPGSATLAGPTMNPVFRQSLVPARLADGWWQNSGQLRTEDVPSQQFIVRRTTSHSSASVCTKSSLLPSYNVASTTRTCSATTSEHTEGNEVNFGVTNALSEDDIWTKPVDAKNIWSSAAASLQDDSHLNICPINSTDRCHSLKPSVVGVDSALGSSTVTRCDTSAAQAGLWTTSSAISNTAKAGLCNQQSMWATAFGPLTRPSEDSSDNTCRLPPGLETQVLAKFGVIGQRGSQMEKNASVEGSDSGIESVSGDSQGPNSSCSSNELSVTSSSSETAVSAPASVESLLRDAVQQQSVVPVQERRTADDSKFSDTSFLMDIISALVIHEMKISVVPDKSSSEDEFKTREHHPYSCNYVPTSASDEDSCVTSDIPLKQTVAAVCEMGAGRSASETLEHTLSADDTVWLRSSIAQLADMLRRRQLASKAVHSADDGSTKCDKLAGSSSTNCSSQDASVAETLCQIATSCVVSNSTQPHTSLRYDPVFGNTSATDRQDESRLVNDETGVRLPDAGASTSSTTYLQTDVKHDVSLMSDNATAANVQNSIARIFGEKTGFSVPVSGTDTCDADSVACTSSLTANPDISLIDKSPLGSCDTAPVQ